MQTVVPSNADERIVALKVLIVDDDPFMRRVVRAMLAAIGVEQVTDACNGAIGLETIRTLTPDIVILDWEMPALDGMHIVRLVRTSSGTSTSQVPIIMLSGHGDRWRVVEAKNAGVNEYLLKPVSTKALRDRILSILNAPRETVKVDGCCTLAPRRGPPLKTIAPPPPVSPIKRHDVFLLN
jgi:DNA-binding response OmpR family regulator